MNKTNGEEWLRFPLPIYDQEGLRILMSKRLGNGQFDLEWDGAQLGPVYWLKRTPERVAAGEEVFGTSFAEALSKAAAFFGVSYSSLHRMVRPLVRTRVGTPPRRLSAACFYRIRKVRHYPDTEAFRKQLDHVVMGPTVSRVVREYLAYIEREIDRFGIHRAQKHEMIFRKYSPKGELRKEFLARQSFHKSCARLGAPATRAVLADRRIYDVIIGWQRMRNALLGSEQSRIVRAGYRRELQLLRNEMNVLRDAIKKAAK